MRKIQILSILLVLLLFVTACSAGADKPLVKAAFLKGPTGLGAASLIAENAAGNAQNQYQITVAGAPDAILSQLITGELDIAALPTNTIALLFARTDGEVQALCVNTLGVLYLLERGNTVSSAADLAGRKIVAAGRGTTVEAVAGRLFPEDAQVDYVAEHAEAVAQVISGAYDLVLVPEPFVTSLLAKDETFRIAMDLTASWEAAVSGPLVMGGIAVRRAFMEQYPDAVAAFLEEYAKSIAFAVENPAEAAALCEQADIMPAEIAEQAIPRANLTLLTGDAMREALDAYYAILMEENSELLGGKLPDASFYAAP